MSFLKGIAALFCVTLIGFPALADAKKVTDVSVEYIGAETVDRSVIQSQIQTKVGAELDASMVEEDIRSLYQSGHVENVRVLNEDYQGGTRVIYRVQTRATLGEIVFVGNTIPSSKLRKEATGGALDGAALEIGKPFDDSVLENARLNVSDYCIKKGYSNVSVTYKVDSAEQSGFSRVTFIIDEGTRERLNAVKFFGNEAISDKELENQMELKAARAYNVFKKDRGIDSALLEEDVIRIEEYYRDNGFLNARITDVQREPEGDKVNLVISISEGDKYSINTVDAMGIEVVEKAQVLEGLQMKPGVVYSSKGIKADIRSLRKYYGNNGYSNVRIMPRITSAGGTSIDILYEVAEGVQTTVELINISGNEKTMDKVIRRELALNPGDVYNEDFIQVSRNRLMGLDYFDSVDITPTAASTPYHTDLNINVREKSTGSVNFGAGFSSIDNLVGFIDVVQTNFKLRGRPHVGAGQKIHVSVKAGAKRKDFQLDFTEPWLFDQKLTFGTGVSYRDLLFLSDKYDQTEISGYASLRKRLGEHSSLSGKVTLQNIEVSVDDDASELLQEEEGDFSRALIGLTYTYDTRDDQKLTRRGHRISTGLTASMGDVSNVSFDLSGSKYFLLPFDTIFSISGQFSTVDGDTPIFDRKFLGGANNLRGYGFREATGIGLRDEQGEALGGSSSSFFTLEYSFPVGNLKKLRGHVFYDGGTLSSDSWDLGGDYLSDYGIGVDLFLPVGPIRVDLAFPQQTDEFTEDDFRVQFNMGYKFR